MPWTPRILATRVLEYGVRRSGLLFREALRYFTISPDAFDLVHAHSCTVHLVGTDLPLVTSAGYPLSVLYEFAFGWSHRHAAIASHVERLISPRWRAEVPWLPPRRAALSLVQSDHFRNTLVASGAEPDRVIVCTTGLDGVPAEPRPGPPLTVGFIAKNFTVKGGPVVLRAFRKLLLTHPEVRLMIVGSDPVPHGVSLPSGSVEWHGPVGRREVSTCYYPASTCSSIRLPAIAEYPT